MERLTRGSDLAEDLRPRVDLLDLMAEAARWLAAQLNGLPGADACRYANTAVRRAISRQGRTYWPYIYPCTRRISDWLAVAMSVPASENSRMAPCTTPVWIASI